MKWVLLIVVALAGLDAIRPAEPVYDSEIAQACGNDATCIRRHINARRDTLGAQWGEPPARFIVWTPPCPDVVWINFQACSKW